MLLSLGNKYVIDTNVLITLMNYYRPNDPTFKAIWDEIEELIKQKNIFTTEVVYDEIMTYLGKDDRLKKWAKANKKRFFIPTNPEIFQLAQDIIRKFPDFPNKKKLLTGEPDADPFLIALAQSEGATIVTQEKQELNKVPLIASRYGVKSIDHFGFFTERRLKFIKE